MGGPPGPPTSFRQRAKRSDLVTKQAHVQRKAQVAGRTKDALDKFDQHLARLASLEFKAYDELDDTAKANRSRVDGLGRSRSEALFSRETSDPNDTSPLNSARTAQMTPDMRDLSKEHIVLVKRPPSPLGLYDYGGISLKPRSVFAQDRAVLGETTRPEHRRTASTGFYFPGARFERGPYGFSVLDPVLMPRSHKGRGGGGAGCDSAGTTYPRSGRRKGGDDGDAAAATYPERWRGDPGDLRPLAAHALALGRAHSPGGSSKRNHADKPVISESVRTTAAHAARSKWAFHHLDKRREEGVLEQARFEHGVYEGRWRDPLLDRRGEMPEPSPPIDHTWIKSLSMEQMSPEQVVAMRVLYGVDAAMRNSMGRFSDLFAAENSGPKGVLELDEFRRGLIRLGSFDKDEISLQAIRQAAPIIDPSGNGRIHLPVVARAVAAIRRLPQPPPSALLGARISKLWGQRKPSPPVVPIPAYGEAAPVDAVKLDHNAGLHNFRKSMEKFRAQQRDLLIHHKEICEDTDA